MSAPTKEDWDEAMRWLNVHLAYMRGWDRQREEMGGTFLGDIITPWFVEVSAVSSERAEADRRRLFEMMSR